MFWVSASFAKRSIERGIEFLINFVIGVRFCNYTVVSQNSFLSVVLRE